MTEQFVNFVAMRLVGGCSPSTTSITVAPFVSLPSTGTFRLLIDSEIVLVDASSSGVLGVERGQEGTTAAAHADGTAVVPIVTAAAMNQIIADILAQALGSAAQDLAENGVDADLDLSAVTANAFVGYYVALTAPRTLKLPTTPRVGQRITIVDVLANFASPNPLTIDTQGLGNLGYGGGTTLALQRAGLSLILQWTGVNWAIVSYVDPALQAQLAALPAQVTGLAAGTGFTIPLAQGGILYSADGIHVGALAVGSEFQTLKSNGSVPQWT